MEWACHIELLWRNLYCHNKKIEKSRICTKQSPFWAIHSDIKKNKFVFTFQFVIPETLMGLIGFLF